MKKIIRKIKFFFLKKNIIVVWFSCGAASAIAAKKTIEKYGKYHKIMVVNNPVVNEHIDNKRFLNDVEKWIGKKIIYAKAMKFPSMDVIDVFLKKKYMSGNRGAPCTVELKKQARYEFELKHDISFHVLGFTVDEKNRHDRFVKFERENLIPVLINDNISKGDCFTILKISGIEIPVMYKLGYPNANCIGCVKASSPTYWNKIRVDFPKTFEILAKLSRKIGCKLVRVKGKRIYLDELDPKAKGLKIKTWECSIFC